MLAAVLVLVAGAATGVAAAEERCAFWIDLYSGEPVAYTELIEDLAGIDVVYLGEKHTLERHHRLQEQVLEDMAARGPVALALEQLLAEHQPQLDRYNAGEIDFDQLVEAIDWGESWPRYEQYRDLVETARRLGAPVIGLNAPVGTVRQVARQGLENLDPEVRSRLPDEMHLDDPMYRRHMQTVMSVHAHAAEHPGMIDKMFQAQVARDETMAHALATFLSSEEGKDRRAVVVTGSGHVEHAMGVPSRVRRRLPDVQDRIIVMSDSGDVQLSKAEMMAVNEEFALTHADLRHLQTPLADYLHVLELRPASQSEEKQREKEGEE
jgi:uncharacterized iron-regulated protein